MSVWESILPDGRGVRFGRIRPPANFATLLRCRTEQSGRFTYSGFIAADGTKLLRISEDGKDPVWVQVRLIPVATPGFSASHFYAGSAV